GAIARPAVVLNCNAAIFENSRDLLIVDTHSKPSAVVALVAQLRREVTAKPVRYIVNSHFHWDHTQGTPAYRKAAPQADIVASEATRKLLAENGASRLSASVEQVRKSVDEYRRKLGDAKTPDQKQAWSRFAEEAEAYLTEMRNYAPELPNVTFERDLIIHDKAHDLHLAFRGRGHTAGDVVVWAPQKRVVATGDLLHGFPPYLGDSWPREWPLTLLRVAEFDFAHVIGGHAGVQHTRDRLYQMGAYIEELSDIVARGKARGLSLEQIQTAATPDKVLSLKGPYAEYLREAARYLAQAPDARADNDLAQAVRSNLSDIYRTIDKS
ncbi:MAG TPA: MBL fold metallo-hydrolase, partial [Bryobacteraceae bacterium]|nr:MBL fold metallo-hydrolase [Bryobacteraceae bacterium]